MAVHGPDDGDPDVGSENEGDWFADVADDPALGGKARSLARLEAAGLPTPRGFVVTDALFRALLPPGQPLAPLRRLDGGALDRLTALHDHLSDAAFPAGFVAALARRLAALTDASRARSAPGCFSDRFSVRSSFAGEDRPGSLAAGVYESRTNLAAEEVPAALRAVLRSAVSAGAAAYALARKSTPGAPPVAVLVHGYVPGDASGAAAWDPAGGRPALIDAPAAPGRGPPAPAAEQAIGRALELLAGYEGAVEIEWVAAGDAVTFLQLRPYAAPPRPAPWPGWDELPATERDGRWQWDAAHNPLPLSTAHAGLVAAVDERCRIGIRQRVLGGYLFWSPGGPAPAETLSPAELPAALATLAGSIEAHLHALGPAPGLEPALQGFFPLYERIFGVLQPAARAARRRLHALLAAMSPAALPHLPALMAGVGSRAGERLRLAEQLVHAPAGEAHDQAGAAYLAVFGDEAPVWDIAVPTHREAPERLAALAGAETRRARPAPDAAETAAQIRARLPPEARPAFDQTLARARAAATAGEDDDWLYARLQAPIRQAVLALGRGLAAGGHLHRADDAFHLPLSWLRAHARGEIPPGDPASLAEQGRARRQDALAQPPDLAAPGAGAGNGAVLRGTGSGGRAVGPVVIHHGPSGGPPPRDAVLVARTLLPTELPLLRVAALVTETGGPLDHVATQARERGLPAVVGAAGALAALADGDQVVVDADRGLVVKLGPPD